LHGKQVIQEDVMGEAIEPERKRRKKKKE